MRSFLVACALAVVLPGTTVAVQGQPPAAGTFEFGMGGMVGGIPGGGALSQGRWGVSLVGSQLIISDSTTVRNAAGRATTKATGAIWVLDEEGRLVIEFGERRTGQDPKNATLVYVRSSH